MSSLWAKGVVEAFRRRDREVSRLQAELYRADKYAERVTKDYEDLQRAHRALQRDCSALQAQLTKPSLTS